MTLVIALWRRSGDWSINLNVHGRFPGLPGALAVDSVLADQHHRIGQQIERDRKAAAFQPHAKFVFFECLAAVVIDGHSFHALHRPGPA